MSPLDTLDALTGPARERYRHKLLEQILGEDGAPISIDPSIDEHIDTLSGDAKEAAEQIKDDYTRAIWTAESLAPERDRQTMLAVLETHRALRRLVFRIKP